MFGTLMLDTDGDHIAAVEEDEKGALFNTIGVAVGVQAVSQNMSLRVSSRKTRVWFNRDAGIAYDELFYNANRNDATMNPLRAQAFREALENTPGFGAYAGSNEVSFTRNARELAVTLPCVALTCEDARITPITIG